MSTKLAVRILFVSSHPVQYTTPLFRALNDRPGVRLTVWYGHIPSPEEQGTAGYGGRFDWGVDLLAGYSWRLLQNEAREPSPVTFLGIDGPEVAERLLKERPDAVVVNGWNFAGGVRAMAVARAAGLPVLVRGDSKRATANATLKERVKAWVYPSLLSQMQGVLPVGSASRDYFVRYGVPPERIFVIPHTVDLERFQKGAEEGRLRRPELRQELGIPANAVVFAFVGRLIEVKRPFDFVEALPGPESWGRGCWGLVVGSGPLEPDLRRRARSRGARVAFAGFRNQSELPRLLGCSDALVLPSGSETWGLVVNEAMAAGLPCFVSNGAGAAGDLLGDGEAGAVYPAGEVSALQGLVRRFCEKAAWRREMSAAAVGKSASFAPERAATLLEEAVRAVIEMSRTAESRADRRAPNGRQ